MKKLLALLLAVIVCLSLVACGGGNNSKAIVGEWERPTSELRFTFNQDGTGEWIEDGSTISFTWKYDKELSCYTAASSGGTFNATLTTDNDIECLQINIGVSSLKLYHPDDCEQALEITLDNYRANVANIAEGKEKLQLNTAYTIGDIVVEFTDVFVSEEYGAILLSASVTNNGTDAVWVSDLISGNCQSKIYYYGGSSSGDVSFVSTDFTICADECKSIDCWLAIFSSDKIKETLDAFGEIIGIAYFEMDGTEYYVELSDYFKK